MAKSIFNSIDILLLEIDQKNSPDEHEVSIASVSFGAGPGGGDYRHYVLEHNDDLTEWSLWFSIVDEWSDPKVLDEDGDLEQPMLYGLMARATTILPALPKVVAAELLRATWREEMQHSSWETDFGLFQVDGPGLLSANELKQIVNDLLRETSQPEEPSRAEIWAQSASWERTEFRGGGAQWAAMAEQARASVAIRFYVDQYMKTHGHVPKGEHCVRVSLGSPEDGADCRPPSSASQPTVFERAVHFPEE